jgi:hypothetical protein
VDSKRRDVEMKVRLPVLVALCWAVTLIAAPTAAANDFQCTTVVTLGTFDNVVVPQGAFCDISNSQVQGNIKALAGSRLWVSGGNRIGGSVEGDKAADVEIFNRGGPSNVIHGNGVIVEDSLATAVCGAVLPNGDISIIKNRGFFLAIGGSPCTAFFGGGNTVQKGNIKVEDSVITSTFEVSDNRVAQNVQVFKNSGAATKRVMNNTAGESVQCFDNVPPFIGGPNFAPKREGQCF